MATAINPQLEIAPIEKEGLFSRIAKSLRTSSLFRNNLIYNIENARTRFTGGSGGRHMNVSERKHALLDYFNSGGDLALLKNKEGDNSLATLLNSDINNNNFDNLTRKVINAYKQQGLINANLIKLPDNNYDTIGNYIGDKINHTIENMKPNSKGITDSNFKTLNLLMDSGAKVHSFVGAKMIKNLTNLNKNSENLLPDSASKVYDSLLENKKTLEQYCLSFEKDTAVLDYEYKKFIINYNKNELNKKNLDNIKYLLNNNMGCNLGFLEATFEIAKKHPNNKELNSLFETLKEKRPELVQRFEEKNRKKEVVSEEKKESVLENIVKKYETSLEAKESSTNKVENKEEEKPVEIASNHNDNNDNDNVSKKSNVRRAR